MGYPEGMSDKSHEVEGDTKKIKGKEVDLTGLKDNQILVYKEAEDKFVAEDKPAGGPGGGDMLKSTYDVNDNGVVDNSEKLEGSTKAQVQDHDPKAHTLASHSTKAHSELTNITADQHHTQSHDHSLVGDGTPIAVAGVPNLDAAKITTGTFDIARIPNMDDAHIPNLETLSYGGAFALAQIPRLDLSKIPLGTSGYFLKGQGVSDSLYALLVATDIPNLDATKIATGIFDQARIPWASVPAGGLTIGADTTLYRSAPDILKTDDRFDSLRALLTGETSDPTLADGLLWHRTDLGKLRARVKGLTGDLISIPKIATSVSTVSATTTETAFANVTVTLPANYLQIGKTIRIKLWGLQTSSSSPSTIRVRCRYGGVSGTILVDTGTVTPTASLANALTIIDVIITCITIGTTGTVEVQGMITWNSNAAPTNRGMGTGGTGAGNTGVITINTTTQNDLVITCVFGATTTGNSLAIRAGTVEVE